MTETITIPGYSIASRLRQGGMADQLEASLKTADAATAPSKEAGAAH